VRGYRDGENPARWRGHLDKLLPARAKIRKIKHHAALPYDEVADFLRTLQLQDGVAARALEFAILTAARTGEVIGAVWGEMNVSEGLWTIPANRMKAGREHRVPLTARALAILAEMRHIDGARQDHDFVFLGSRLGRPLSNMAFLMLLRRMKRENLTVHGFRSSFRDWAAERTNFPSEVAEMALAHAISDKTEKAYRRGDLFDRRRRLMAAWGEFALASRHSNAGQFCSPASHRPLNDANCSRAVTFLGILERAPLHDPEREHPSIVGGILKKSPRSGTFLIET
jgi:integrase